MLASDCAHRRNRAIALFCCKSPFQAFRLQRENKRLMEANMRLEMENDDLAQELNVVRLTLGTQLEKVINLVSDLHQYPVFLKLFCLAYQQVV